MNQRNQSLRRCLWLFAALTTTGASATEWSDRTRDVYIDGRLDRTAQVFAARESDHVAVMVASLPRAVVFDEAELTVGWLEKSELVLNADRTGATCETSPRTIEGTCLKVDEASYLIATGGHTLLVAPHQGEAGDVELDELWRTAPVWKSRAAVYEPDRRAVEALAAVDRDVEVRVVFGTWCGDSKHYVPELLESLEQAANPRIHLRLTSIRRGFTEPLDFVRDHRVTNVPTVIVSEGGREIGRIVETPAAANVEADLAAILDGEVPNHTGRWQRDQQLARGTYEYFGAGGERLGKETFEVFSDEDGGTLLHSRAQLHGRTTEIWQRRDGEGATVFVEITREGPGEHSRSRHWIKDGRLRSITRGNTTGIIEQTAELPERWTVLLPAAASAGQAGPGAESGALRLSGAGAPAAGLVEPVTFARIERREVETPAGHFLAEGLERRVGDEVSRWWLHPRLALPVAGEVDGSGKVVLNELEIGALTLNAE